MQASEVRDLADARERNPKLTVFDTGEMLEPVAGVTGMSRDKTGVVEFTNDESIPIVSISAFPSKIHDDTVVVQIDTMALIDEKLMVVVNDGPAICHFDPEVDDAPMYAAAAFVRARRSEVDLGIITARDALALIADALEEV